MSSSNHSKTHKKKNKKNTITLKNKTPKNIIELSNSIKSTFFKSSTLGKSSFSSILNMSSYSPSINKELISLKSISREKYIDCNIEKAFELKEPLRIGVPINSGKDYECYEYNDKKAIEFLLKNLSANKHINPSIIIPPIQSESNCWFNTFFATFFISDKGRKFFHFFRSLMIIGEQKKGNKMPKDLADGFALLNYSIDACLTGNGYSYILDTNSIIHKIYQSIPREYKLKKPYIVDIKKAGNPVLYYISLINYLDNIFLSSQDKKNLKKPNIKLEFIRGENKENINTTQDILNTYISSNGENVENKPELFIIEILDNDANKILREEEIRLGNIKYKLDSAVIRDISKQHFCATLTCEKKEMGYDGMSFHRLIDFKWKKNLNKNYNWIFEGTIDNNGSHLKWNFTKCYQMLFYYRITK